MKIAMTFSFIDQYDNPAELIRNYSDETFSDEIMHYLDHVNDFESLSFYVMDGTTVITCDAGDVISADPLDEFIRQSIDYAREEISNEI